MKIIRSNYDICCSMPLSSQQGAPLSFRELNVETPPLAKEEGIRAHYTCLLYLASLSIFLPLPHCILPTTQKEKQKVTLISIYAAWKIKGVFFCILQGDLSASAMKQ